MRQRCDIQKEQQAPDTLNNQNLSNRNTDVHGSRPANVWFRTIIPFSIFAIFVFSVVLFPTEANNCESTIDGSRKLLEVFYPNRIILLARSNIWLYQKCVKEDEKQDSFKLLLLLLLLVLGFLMAFSLRELHWVYLHESTTSILLGAIVGGSIRFFSDDQNLKRVTSFDAEFFFLFLLPPIIFESGYTTNKRVFFNNIGSICFFAIFGTLISAMVIGIGLAGIKLLWNEAHELKNVECFLFGAWISATDPVTVLAIFKELRVDRNLYSNVFGESVINDASAIVLYKTFLIFLEQPVNAKSIAIAIGQFIYIFVGSLVVGVAMALLSALLFKYAALYRHPNIEVSILILYAYSSYLFAEGMHLSGIVSILFCGMAMAHYTRRNVGIETKYLSINIFGLWTAMSETFVFIYLGLSIFSFRIQYDFLFIVFSLFLCLLGRALNIFPLSAGVNFIRGSSANLPFSHQFMIWYSGLRGAIAFVLATEYSELSPDPNHGPLLFTTTLAIVLITVVGLGGSTVKILKLLKITMGDDSSEGEEEGKKDDVFVNFENQFIKPIFCRESRPTLQLSPSFAEIQLELDPNFNFNNLNTNHNNGPSPHQNQNPHEIELEEIHSA